MDSNDDVEAIASDPNLEIITTFAYSAGLPHNEASLSGSHCYLLQYGIDRLQAAASDLSWTAVAEDLRSIDHVESLSKEVSAHMLSSHGEASKDPGRRFVPYSAAWERVGMDGTTSPAEYDVLLQNKYGHIMGAAFRTVYFWRDGRLVTPSRVTGCKMGVSRRWAVDNAGVKESFIAAMDISDGEVIWLSSAVGGFIQGKVTLERKTRVHDAVPIDPPDTELLQLRAPLRTLEKVGKRAAVRSEQSSNSAMSASEVISALECGSMNARSFEHASASFTMDSSPKKLPRLWHRQRFTQNKQPNFGLTVGWLIRLRSNSWLG
ncbi:aminodeoxychorismate lyase [Colletotrichum incanum]|uniref:Aminodeoxychorismate lyase n=1 Tax=Colletotrichum incanum TaxID=1573173 RepID=A0A161YCD4_COLIC|nr:aminodeoxychorismate lyase [Colletotrichum incanum]